MTLTIETKDLRYTLGKSFEVAQLDMHVPHKSVYGFLGPNGSGKTTTIRLILGLLKPHAGRITVLGTSMPDGYPFVLARTGYVPERPHLYPSLTVEEALRFHGAFYPTWDQRWAYELLQQFALDAKRKISALSKGEGGKLQMLLALAQQPDLLVLDEPTDGLDPIVRRDILSAVLQYVTDRAATVLISSHLVHELERICDWVGLMDHGRLVAELPMQEFRSGLKRLRVSSAPDSLTGAPFTLLSRERGNGAVEQWLVRGWTPSMQEYFGSVGASLREVIDLDLEEGFVEMLRSARQRVGEGGLMFGAILWSQWKWTRGMVLITAILAFGLPLGSLQASANSLHPNFMVATMAQFGSMYPILAALTGLLVALAAWSPDHAGRHTYALSLPVHRSRYAMLRYGVGAVFLGPTVVALLVGTGLVAASGAVPEGLHAYPVALTLRFTLAALVAYSLFFAIASSTPKTAAVILGAIAAVFFTQYLLSVIGFRFDVLGSVEQVIFYRPGLLSVFAGRWMLVDV